MPYDRPEVFAACLRRARDRYVRLHRAGSMATVCATILFDTLADSVAQGEQKPAARFSRAQLRDAMAAHPAWEGKAFEPTSFNTVPEDLGEQLAAFTHEEVLGGVTRTFTFAGPTKKFRADQSSRELYLEWRVDPPLESSAEPAPVPPRRVRPERLALAAAITLLIVFAAALRQAHQPSRAPAPQAVAMGAQQRVSVAVLPFHVINDAREIGFLRVGLPDSIITTLANYRQVSVRPTSMIVRYNQEPLDLAAAAAELKTDYLLTGTIQETADRLRATVQLLHTPDLAPVWGDRYDIARGDLLSLQDDIADKVSSMLRVRATPAERTRARRHTASAAAFELYMRGRAALLRESGSPEALSLFEKAIEIDPSYAAAYAGIVLVCGWKRFDTGGTAEQAVWKERAEKAGTIAVSLAPDSGETHEALARLYADDDFGWEKAIPEAKRALELNPSLAVARRGLIASYVHLGLLRLAREEIGEQFEILHDAKERDDELGRLEFFAAHFAAARRIEEELGATANESWMVPLERYYTGDAAAAFRMLASPKNTVMRARFSAMEAAIAAAAHDRSRARKAIAAALATRYVDHHVAWYVGAAYGQLGEHDAARKWLQQAADSGWPCYPLFTADPLLAPFRASAQGMAFSDSLRQRWLANKSRYGET